MGQVLRFREPEGSPEDIARERRIAAYATALKAAAKQGPWGMKEAMRLQALMSAEIAARSPEQVKRMERAKGLRP